MSTAVTAVAVHLDPIYGERGGVAMYSSMYCWVKGHSRQLKNSAVKQSVQPHKRTS